MSAEMLARSSANSLFGPRKDNIVRLRQQLYAIEANVAVLEHQLPVLREVAVLRLERISQTSKHECI